MTIQKSMNIEGNIKDIDWSTYNNTSFIDQRILKYLSSVEYGSTLSSEGYHNVELSSICI